MNSLFIPTPIYHTFKYKLNNLDWSLFASTSILIGGEQGTEGSHDKKHKKQKKHEDGERKKRKKEKKKKKVRRTDRLKFPGQVCYQSQGIKTKAEPIHFPIEILSERYFYNNILIWKTSVIIPCMFYLGLILYRVGSCFHVPASKMFH